MTTIRADEIRPGDVIVYDGRVHCITRVDREPGWAWPIACDETGWAIALGHRLLDLAQAAA
jgi:hypothetical protein